MYIDPFAFYVGKVVQRFDGTTQTVNMKDLSDYIDREGKLIASQTGELMWDYGNGVVQYDTPCFQGALGFYRGKKVELTNVTIETDNEYVTVACVSLDGDKPLPEASRILVQAMTEDHFKGFSVTDGVIDSVGGPPLVVTDIHVTLTFKGVLTRYVSKLDEFGRVYEKSSFPRDGKQTLSLRLDRDAMYTLLTVEEEVGETIAHTPKTDLGGEWALQNPPVWDPFDPSPIDLRYLNEEYAGVSGFVRREGENFLLGNGQPVKFWAVCSNPQFIGRISREHTLHLAKRLAKLGVNLIRVNPRGHDWDENGVPIVKEEYLDKVHFFISAMKAEGIYVKLVIYFSAILKLRAGCGIPGFTGKYDGAAPMALLQFNEAYQEMYKQCMRKSLLTTNPYTGIPLAKDPAVAIIEVQNEDSFLFWTFSREFIPETQWRMIEGFYTEFLLNKYGSAANVYADWEADWSQTPQERNTLPYGALKCGDCLTCGACDANDRFALMDIVRFTHYCMDKPAFKKRAADQLQFLVEFQKGFYEKMVDFYKNEIGSESLINPSNWVTADQQLMEGLERYTYTAGDVIDRHGYMESGHTGETASLEVKTGHTCKSLSVAYNPERAIMQSNAVKGFPHIISETTWPMPNRFHGEAVPMWALYGALQGMDGIIFFVLNEADWESNPSAKWPVMTPAVAGQFPAFALMYRKGFVREGDTVVEVAHSLKELYSFKGMPIYENLALDNFRGDN